MPVPSKFHENVSDGLLDLSDRPPPRAPGISCRQIWRMVFKASVLME